MKLHPRRPNPCAELGRVAVVALEDRLELGEVIGIDVLDLSGAERVPARSRTFKAPGFP